MCFLAVLKQLLVVRTFPFTVLYFPNTHLKLYVRESRRSLRGGETDSDGRTERSVSLTSGSRQVIHTGRDRGQTRAPVTSPQRRDSFSASPTEQCARWQAGVYLTASWATLLSSVWHLNTNTVFTALKRQYRYGLLEPHVSFTLKW